MFLSLFIKGIVMGLAVSVPLGPIGVLIVQRTLNKNRYSGFFSGMGASISDTLYAILAGFGVSYILDFIKDHVLIFHIIGGLVILLLGVHIFFKNPRQDVNKYRTKGNSYLQDMVSTFLITFPNPMVVFVFLAVFASSGVVFQLDQPSQAFFMILGVFTGANIWWFSLTSIINAFRHRFNLRVIWWFNKISGGVLMLLVIISFILTIIKQVKLF